MQGSFTLPTTPILAAFPASHSDPAAFACTLKHTLAPLAFFFCLHMWLFLLVSAQLLPCPHPNISFITLCVHIWEKGFAGNIFAEVVIS